MGYEGRWGNSQGICCCADTIEDLNIPLNFF